MAVEPTQVDLQIQQLELAKALVDQEMVMVLAKVRDKV